MSKAKYGIKREGIFYVPTRDGIKLVTEVWLPDDMPERSKVPATLVRTPYGRFKWGEPELRFVHRGYALIAQDTRGREDSEGQWVPFIHEMDDGDDTLNWIAVQPWSNGRMGMIGPSYMGVVQWAAAASGNPHLKALVSQVTAHPITFKLPRKGGIILSRASMMFSYGRKTSKSGCQGEGLLG